MGHPQQLAFIIVVVMSCCRFRDDVVPQWRWIWAAGAGDDGTKRTSTGRPWADTGLVFTQEDGSWLHPGKVTDLFERLVAASGLPPIRLHDLRHGAATLMLAAGIDVKIVSDTLGHSDTRITRDLYQSVLPHVGKSSAEATAKLVPLQRKAEAEKAARKAAKAAQKAKEKAKAQAKAEKKKARKKPKK